MQFSKILLKAPFLKVSLEFQGNILDKSAAPLTLLNYSNILCTFNANLSTKLVVFMKKKNWFLLIDLVDTVQNIIKTLGWCSFALCHELVSQKWNPLAAGPCLLPQKVCNRGCKSNSKLL